MASESDRAAPSHLGDRYELLGKLGEGATAVVYLARDARLDRRVAVKVLKAERREDPPFVERLQREARLAASLSHPNVVAVYDLQCDPDVCYLVMEHVEGESLKDRIARAGRLGVPEAVDVARQVLAALEVAHRAGILHRDVKPQNVLITHQGVAKLADFGIALGDQATPLTQAGTAVGTPHYLAPERARGKPATPASDVYSVGVVLYEMLTGRLPFEADSSVAIAMQHLVSPPEPPRVHAPGLPAGLERIVLRALAKLPEERWPGAGEMAGALESCVARAKQPTTATPVFGWQALLPARVRPRLAGWGLSAKRWGPLPRVVAVVALLLGVGAGLSWLAASLSRPAASGGPGEAVAAAPAVSPTPTGTGSLGDAFLRIVVPPTATPTPTPVPPTSTPTPTRTPTPTPSPTSTFTPTPTATATPPPTATPIPTSTPTPLPVVVEMRIPPLAAAEHRISTPLRPDQTIVATISVRGGRGDVRVTVFGGDGAVVLGPQMVTGEQRLSWSASQRGPWRVVFDNGFSLLTAKQVTFSYQVVSR